MVTLASFRAGKHAWLLGALARPGIFLLSPGECAENAIWLALEDLAELDDTRPQLDEVSRRLRTWLGVGGAPALPVTVAWMAFVGHPPSVDTVLALYVGMIAELNLLDAPLHDRPPPDVPPSELSRWASGITPSWTTLQSNPESRTMGVRLGHALNTWVMVHPKSAFVRRPWVLRPAPTLRQALTLI